MVPVNSTALARSFAVQLADLRQGIWESWHAEAPEAGLVEWAAFRSGTRLETGAEALAVAKIPARRRAEAPILAAVGFRLPLPGNRRRLCRAVAGRHAPPDDPRPRTR